MCISIYTKRRGIVSEKVNFRGMALSSLLKNSLLMNFLVWNIGDLNNPSKEKGLKTMVKNWKYIKISLLRTFGENLNQERNIVKIRDDFSWIEL